MDLESDSGFRVAIRRSPPIKVGGPFDVQSSRFKVYAPQHNRQEAFLLISFPITEPSHNIALNKAHSMPHRQNNQKCAWHIPNIPYSYIK